MIEFKEASSKKDYLVATDLFTEYVVQLGIDLSFQNFEEELASLSIMYSKPQGVLIIAMENEKAVGCFGIRKLEDSIGELKRMYIREKARGFGYGKQLLQNAIETAAQLGYSKMRLDTLATMGSAIHLYKQVGFYEMEPYRFNPMEGAKYFEIELYR
ncbi:MAG: GNAT family N-acetyltransferase [Flammeovirgaceae bacterium]|nr:GNAT family N-acetyltransferase [Flammeovirgaceae bacterium]